MVSLSVENNVCLQLMTFLLFPAVEWENVAALKLN